MKNKSLKYIATLIILLIVGILIYFSPDENYWFDKNPREAIKEPIKLGRSFACELLISNERGLLKIAAEPSTKEKIKKSNLNKPLFTQYTYEQRLAIKSLPKAGMPYKFIDPLNPVLFSEKIDEIDMDLVMLEKLEDFTIMTFAYKYGPTSEIVELPEKGKMLFTVGIRYNECKDDLILPKLGRKMANLPLLRSLIGHRGTKGRWMVVDYKYKYNLNDYWEWILKKGGDYKETKKPEEIVDEFINKIKNGKWIEEIKESALRQLGVDSGWALYTVEEQIGRYEILYKQREEIYEELKKETK